MHPPRPGTRPRRTTSRWHLLEWARSSAILVVALARPELLERRSTWGSGHRSSTTTHLEPLAAEAMGDLLRGLVPGVPVAPLEQIVDRAEGVPLYAVETIRMLIDEERLVLSGERYRLVDEDRDVAVPATLQALVTARLDALEPAERALVQDASVIGKTFARDALAAIGDREQEVLDALLPGLVRKDIVAIETSRTSPELGQYGFVQGLIREVAYSTLSRRDRRARHLAAARYFESLGDEELAGLVASHYLDAYRSAPDGAEGEEAASQASRALLAAAERSVSLHANAAALAFTEQALSVTTDPETRARLWVIAYEPASARGELDVAERYLRQAIAWYRQNGRYTEANRATAVLASMMVHLSRGDDVRALVEPALEELDIDSDPSAPQLLNELARAYLWDGRAGEALEPLDRGLRIAERLQLEREIGELFATKSWAVETQGRHREALLLAEGSLEIAVRLGVVATELRARMNLSNGLLTADPQRAFEVAAIGVELARRIGHAEWTGALAGNQGFAALLVGHWDVPLEHYAEMGSRADVYAFGLAGALEVATVVKALRGEPDEALRRTTLDTLRSIETPQAHSGAFAIEAITAYAGGQLADAAAPALAGTAGTATPGEGMIGLFFAANAVTWLRDRESMAAIATRLRELAWAGALPATCLLQIEAANAALDGDFERAERGYREALARWRQLGLQPDIATAEMEMLLLLGERLDDHAELAREARQILEALRAGALLARLDEVAPVGREMEVTS